MELISSPFSCLYVTRVNFGYNSKCSGAFSTNNSVKTLSTTRATVASSLTIIINA